MPVLIKRYYLRRRVMPNILGWLFKLQMICLIMMVTQLFLMMCGAEQNLKTLSKLGGEKAVYNLSRFADDQKVRQQATVLLTKLAVLNNPAAQK